MPWHSTQKISSGTSTPVTVPGPPWSPSGDTGGQQQTTDTAYCSVRIVAGTAGGRKLDVPEGNTTRPTTDRVREATFNVLYSLDAIEGRSFVDLFAGSGALGLEALSRGAAHVTFIERDRAALTALRTNIDRLDFGQQATVHTGDSLRWLANAGHHDVILADPPYDFDDWATLFDAAECDLLVAESNDAIVAPPAWELQRERAYGSTVVTILTPVSGAETISTPAD